MDMPDAKRIYQDILDTMSTALLARDSRTWHAHIMTPHIMATSDGRAIHETTDQVVRGMENFADSLDRIGVTEIRRECETARLTDPATIVGYHTTWMTRGDGTSLPSYHSKMVLQKLGDNWRISKTHSAIGLSDKGWSVLPHDGVDGYKSQAVDSAAARKVTIQSLMDRVDAILVNGDYEGWRRAVCLPLTMESSRAKLVLRTEDELAADFELYLAEFKIHRVSDIMRIVHFVDMIEPDIAMCHYRVHVLSRGNYVVPPWDAAAILNRIYDTWRISTIKRALGHLNWIASPGGDQK